MNKVKNCGDDQSVVTLNSNTTVKLNKKCQIVPNTCIKTKGFTSANVKYMLFKNNMMLAQGEADVCNAVKKIPAEFQGALVIFGLPDQCPVESVSFSSF